MTELKPTAALGGDKAYSVRHGSLRLEEKGDLALASLALRRGGKVPEPFGIVLPGPGEWSANGSNSVFWVGREQWMVAARGQTDTDLGELLTALYPDCSVTEQTDGFCAFDISSDNGEASILALMSKLVNLDTSRFLVGSATRTVLDHMNVFVIRTAPAHLTILVTRSVAASLWHALQITASRLAEARP